MLTTSKSNNASYNAKTSIKNNKHKLQYKSIYQCTANIKSYCTNASHQETALMQVIQQHFKTLFSKKLHIKFPTKFSKTSAIRQSPNPESAIQSPDRKSAVLGRRQLQLTMKFSPNLLLQ